MLRYKVRDVDFPTCAFLHSLQPATKSVSGSVCLVALCTWFTTKHYLLPKNDNVEPNFLLDTHFIEHFIPRDTVQTERRFWNPARSFCLSLIMQLQVQSVNNIKSTVLHNIENLSVALNFPQAPSAKSPPLERHNGTRDFPPHSQKTIMLALLCRLARQKRLSVVLSIHSQLWYNSSFPASFVYDVAQVKTDG